MFNYPHTVSTEAVFKKHLRLSFVKAAWPIMPLAAFVAVALVMFPILEIFGTNKIGLFGCFDAFYRQILMLYAPIWVILIAITTVQVFKRYQSVSRIDRFSENDSIKYAYQSNVRTELRIRLLLVLMIIVCGVPLFRAYYHLMYRDESQRITYYYFFLFNLRVLGTFAAINLFFPLFNVLSLFRSRFPIGQVHIHPDRFTYLTAYDDQESSIEFKDVEDFALNMRPISNNAVFLSVRLVVRMKNGTSQTLDLVEMGIVSLAFALYTDLKGALAKAQGSGSAA